MPFRFSVRARADLRDIAAYTIEKHGEAQAKHYLSQLEACCDLVAKTPGIARPCDHIRPGYRRIEEGQHVLLVKFDAEGLLIIRVLHDRMLPGLHVTDDDEDE